MDDQQIYCSSANEEYKKIQKKLKYKPWWYLDSNWKWHQKVRLWVLTYILELKDYFTNPHRITMRRCKKFGVKNKR